MTETNLSDECPECGMRISYLAARPAKSGLSKCPACERLVFFLRFLTYEVHTAKIRPFSHKIGVEEWVRKRQRGERSLGDFMRGGSVR